MPKINVCLSPDLLHLYALPNCRVVVTDVFRATSCITTALAHGVAAILPVASVEECKSLQAQGLLAAAERNAQKVAGFDLDNSPFSYMAAELKGQKIAMTTTNGTYCIAKSKSEALEVLAGSFLNLHAVAHYLSQYDHDVLVLAAGWKSHPSLEDTLYAGALVDALHATHPIGEDSARMALNLYHQASPNLEEYLAEASHIQRLKTVGISKDIAFCLQHSIYDVVPVLKGDELVNHA